MMTDSHEDDSDYEVDDEEDDEYSSLVQSVRSKTGLEVGIRVTWPVESFCRDKNEPTSSDDDDDDNNNDKMMMIELNLSTCLPATEIAPMFHGTQWAGTRVWRAAIVTVQYLLSMSSSGSSSSTHRSPLDEIISSKHEQPQQQQELIPLTRLDILELGCGLGVPGMILQKYLARRQYDCHVVLTDMSSLVEQLRQNIAANFIKEPTESPRIQAHELDWSDAKSIENLIQQTTTTSTPPRLDGDAAAAATGFDLVFNCDCIYEHLYGKESWQALLTCHELLLQKKPNTVCITAVERRNGDGVDDYLQACADSKHMDRTERIILPTTGNLDDDHYHYWAEHPPPPEVELYRHYGRLS